MTKILEVLSLEDAVSALRAVLPEHANIRDRLERLAACDCAEQVLPIYERERPQGPSLRQTLQTARNYADGVATLRELQCAREVANTAAMLANTEAARAAAMAVAHAASVDGPSRILHQTMMAARYAVASDSQDPYTANEVEREWQTNQFPRWVRWGTNEKVLTVANNDEYAAGLIRPGMTFGIERDDYGI